MHNQFVYIHHFLERSAEHYPAKTALIHENVRYCYSKVNVLANKFAHFLVGSGIGRGDRVIVAMENSLEYVAAYYGILKAGGNAVPLHRDSKTDTLQPVIQSTEPFAIIASTPAEKTLLEIQERGIQLPVVVIKKPLLFDRFTCGKHEWAAIAHSTDDTNPQCDIDEYQVANLIFTSGSTSRPKGVMLSHANIVDNVVSIGNYLKLTNADRQMCVLPYSYVMGKSLLNTHFAAGGSIVINNKFAFTAGVIKQMAEERVTAFSGVPATFAHLIYRSPLAQYKDKLPALRYVSQAGGHMADHLKLKLRKLLPSHTEIVVMYGATEASARLSYLDPSRFSDKMRSIGKAIPGVKLKILNPGGQPVAQGKVGEVVAQGKNIMQGYWRNEEATHKALDKDGYHTGDMGYEDEEGFIFLVGRKDNQLKVGGHRIDPQEIEDALLATDLLVDVVVAGLHDALKGKMLAAIAVAVTPDISEENIRKKLASQLPKFKVPEKTILVKSLPKNINGKLDRLRSTEMLKALIVENGERMS
ncbi:MAG: AMP-binding protein [Chitinivibrionales bacterium]|nr:AMP-binding protein [Chitinivibrionales bacterium]